MPPEPRIKRTIAFIDGQNLFHAVRKTFGYTYPNYDVDALARAVCAAQCWRLEQVRFYTGIPEADDDPFWNHFWSSKITVMGRQGVRTFSRPLRYRTMTTRLPDGSTHWFRYAARQRDGESTGPTGSASSASSTTHAWTGGTTGPRSDKSPVSGSS